MGDYNENCLSKIERECLKTILILCGLYVMIKKLPTRVVGTSKTLIGYIITDHLEAETFETMCRILLFVHQKPNPLIIVQHRFLVILKLPQIKKS